jgi:hypothetical protein
MWPIYQISGKLQSPIFLGLTELKWGEFEVMAPRRLEKSENARLS